MLHLIFIYRDFVNKYKHQKPKPSLAELCKKDFEENESVRLEEEKKANEMFNAKENSIILDNPAVDVSTVIVENIASQLEEVKNEIQPDTTFIIENVIPNECQSEPEVNTSNQVSNEPEIAEILQTDSIENRLDEENQEKESFNQADELDATVAESLTQALDDNLTVSIVQPEVAEVLPADSFENRLEEENFNQITESDVRNATPVQIEPELVEQEDLDEIRQSQIEEEQREAESFNEGIQTQEKQEEENFNQITESDVRNATPVQNEPELVEQEDLDEIRQSQIEEEKREAESFNEGIQADEIKEEALNLIDEINSELNKNSLDQNEN